MERKSISDILKEQYDLPNETRKLYNLFKLSSLKHGYNHRWGNFDKHNLVEKYIDENILTNWKVADSCISLQEIEKKLGIYGIDYKSEISFNETLNLLEYFYNLFHILKEHTSSIRCEFNLDFKKLEKNANIMLNNVNHKIIIDENNQEVFIVPKDPAAIAVTEIMEDKHTALAILKYNHASLKGDLAEKKKLLLQILHNLEPILRKPLNGYDKLQKDIGNIANNFNLRHNNTDPKDTGNYKKFVTEMSENYLEMLYDDLYQMLLFYKLANDNLERKEKLKPILEQVI